MKTRVAALTLLAAACTVPDLTIEEQGSSAVSSDAGIDSGAATDARAAEPAKSSKPATGKAPVSGAGQAGEGGSGGSKAVAGSGGTSAADGGGGSGGSKPAADSGGRGGGPAPSMGAAGQGGSSSPTRACAVWTSVSVRDTNPPAGAVEGGFETVAGVTNRQYVCRFRPQGSSYTIPGKYVAGLGCYVTRRDGQNVDDVSMLDGMIEVLTPAAGCSFSWRAASASELPAGAIDLGDPPGGRNYTCHGDTSSGVSSGKQIGTVITSSDDPPQYQCWVESFASAIQPSDPQQFEILVQDQ